MLHRILLTGVMLTWIALGTSVHEYQATGMVLKIDADHHRLLISHDRIEGYMDAMIMPYRVDDEKALSSLKPGDKIDFTLVVTDTSSHIANIHLRAYENTERDPIQAERLKMLDEAMSSKSGAELQAGQLVPDFTLTDQDRRQVTLSDLRGKVVAVTFIYTRCPLPDYCFRLSNNFSRLQKRFDNYLNKDLVLLSITFDPEHDTPEILAGYARTWNASRDGWHFLTGDRAAIKRICAMFGMNFWPDEGLLTHSLHTAVIDRQGKLVANIEGNQFSAIQLGDLVQTELAHRRTGHTTE